LFSNTLIADQITKAAVQEIMRI